MEHQSTSYLPLLLVTGLAFLVPLLARRVPHIPIVVGEILAGIIIGKSGLDLVPANFALKFLAEFGFTLLMFLSGLEVDFRVLASREGEAAQTRWWARPIPISMLMLALTIGLATGASYGLKSGGMIGNPLLMGLILSTTSLGVVLPVLKEQHLLAQRYGQYLLVAATLADFLTLLLLTAVIAMSSKGLSLDLLLVFVLLAVFALVARIGKRFADLPILRRIVEELAHATAQIRVRGAFALMVALVVLSDALGVQVILGAFLAGAIVGLMAGSGENDLRLKLDAIGFGFFVPIFFINVGVEFRLQVLLDSRNAMMLVPILLVIAYAVKLLPGLLLSAVFKFKDALAGGFLMSARLSLIIAASAIALELKAIDEAVNAAVILIAVVSCTLSPLLFNRLRPSAKPSSSRHGVVLVGTNQLAQLLVQRLHKSHLDLTVIGHDERVLRAMKRKTVRVVFGKPEDRETLAAAGADKAEALVVLCENEKLAQRVCALGRGEFDVPLVVAQARRVGSADKLRAIGVRVVQPSIALAVAIEGALRFPTAFDVLVDQDDDVEVGEAVLGHNRHHGAPLKNLRLPGNALILGIQREGAVMVPHGDTVLSAGDHIALIGSPDAVEEAIDLLS
jgi:Kef-type K+ transport system membrane component KefB/Trk K+ transport system NAD-binding subunit